jgi:hypothetical protein
MGEERKVYKVLVGNPEGRRPLGRPRWGQNDLREIGLAGGSGLDSTGSGQGASLFAKKMSQGQRDMQTSKEFTYC